MDKVFAIGRGQYENVGDLILRRQLLDWVRAAGPLHVYVGASPDGYDEGLQLGPDDVVHRSLRRWYFAAFAEALRRPTAYVFKPGEIQLTLIGMKEHLVMLPLLLAIRLRGGRVVRAGVGTRNFAPLPRALMGPSIALSNTTLWRDLATARYMRAGRAMPDLAFAEGAPDEDLDGFAVRSAERDALVVSLRADDPAPAYPSEAWLAGVRRYAAEEGLEVWAVAQVQVDDERTRRLARDLGGQVLGWPVVEDHWPQEQRLRRLYRRTAVAISDRLHVIVAAHTEGAVPVGFLTDASDKIDRHFATIGLHGVAVDATGLGEDDVVRVLRDAEARRPEVVERLVDARARLAVHRDEVHRVLGVPTGGRRTPVPAQGAGGA